MTLDASTSSDPDGNSLTFAWTLVVPQGSKSAILNPTGSLATFIPDIAGTYTAGVTAKDALTTSAPATANVIATAPASSTPQIVVNTAEPLSSTVQLTLSTAVTGTVSWYVDLQLLGAGGAAANSPIAWNTAQVANGPHLIVAQIQRPNGTTDEVRRTVTVNNSAVVLNARAVGTRGSVSVDVTASSPSGIASVSLSIDGGPAATLNAPNACVSRFCSANDGYRFAFDAAVLGSGAHTAVVIATDSVGATKQMTVPFPISNAPIVTVSSPLDGALVSGSLQIDGTASTDKAGTLTITATLGSLEVLRTTSRVFTGAFDLTGVTPGPYTLTIRATDVDKVVGEITRTVVVKSAAAPAPVPLFSLPAGASLLAVDGSSLLYTVAGGAVVLRDMNTAAEVTLARSAQIQYSAGWQISGGRVYAGGQDTDCNSGFFVCIYEWLPDGTVSNLTNANPAATGYQQNPVAKDGFVVWSNSSTGYTIYSASARTFTQVSLPQGANYIGNNAFDLSVSGNVLRLFFWAQTGGSGSTSSFEVYEWRSDTASTTQLTSNGLRNVSVQTDGARVAWQRTPLDGGDGTVTLFTAPATGGVATAVSTNALATSQYFLKEGVLAWVESANTVRMLKANTSTTSATLSTNSTSKLVGSGGGRVVFSEQNKLYSWSSASGATTLQSDTVPTQTFVSRNGALVYRINSSVYRVVLP
ncbi:hypothetical protein J2W36_005199 [Variovorax ginsengisoli]|uniref:Uncharacterized protein n=1 Tax=Variovorax ginsengisoli TaxID=363844 RepID=A0ABT9SEX9_9BURK|nr:Ig-like domain-containing protein [Variovorax ginsengisoli]MDP9902921.1 hypothetical protein [Variovorax ginsengisoli]